MKTLIRRDTPSWRRILILGLLHCFVRSNFFGGIKKFPLQLKIIRVSASRFGVYQNVRLSGNLMEAFSKNFPEQALGPIPDYRISDLSRYG